MASPRSRRRWSSCLALAAVVGGMASGLAAQVAADPAALVRDLGSKNGRVRNRAYQILRRSRPAAAFPLLVKALPSWPLPSQSLGVSLLRVYPEKRMLPAMQKLQRGSASLLAVEASLILFRTHRSTSEARIIRALGEPASPQELNMMLGRVANLNSPAILGAVLDQLAANLPVNQMRSILRAALRAKHAPAVARVKELQKRGGLADSVGMVLDAFLLAMGDASVVGTLAAQVRAAKTLAPAQEFLNQIPKPAPRKLMEAVLTHIEGKKGRVARIGLELLVRHEYAPAVRVMRDLLESQDEALAKTAFEGLLKLNSGLQPRVLRGLLNSKNAKLAVAAADALRRQDDLSGLPQLLALASGKSKAVVEAVTALGKFRSRKVGRPLIRALEHKDRRVRAAAYQGVQRLIRNLFPYRRFDFVAAGYGAQAPAGKRKAAVAKLSHWWLTVGESR